MHFWNQFRRKNRRKPGSIHPVSPPKFTNLLSLIFCRSEAWHSMAGVPDHRIPGWKSKCLPGCHHPQAMDKSQLLIFFLLFIEFISCSCRVGVPISLLHQLDSSFSSQKPLVFFGPNTLTSSSHLLVESISSFKSPTLLSRLLYTDLKDTCHQFRLYE